MIYPTSDYYDNDIGKTEMPTNNTLVRLNPRFRAYYRYADKNLLVPKSVKDHYWTTHNTYGLKFCLYPRNSYVTHVFSLLWQAYIFELYGESILLLQIHGEIYIILLLGGILYIYIYIFGSSRESYIVEFEYIHTYVNGGGRMWIFLPGPKTKTGNGKSVCDVRAMSRWPPRVMVFSPRYR
jgi:hypothetical protein